MLFLLLFLNIFLVHKFNKKLTLLILLFAFLATGLIDYRDFFYFREPLVSVATTISEILIVQCTALLISKHRDLRALFVGITSSVYVLFGNVMCSIVQTYTENFSFAIIAQVLSHTLLISLLIWRLRNDFLEQLKFIKKGWLQLCLISSLFYLSIYTLVVWPVNANDNPKVYLSAICIIILIELTYILIFKFLSNQVKENELQSNNTYLELYASRLKKESDALAMANERAAVMRHDMKHFTAMLVGYINSGELKNH